MIRIGWCIDAIKEMAIIEKRGKCGGSKSSGDGLDWCSQIYFGQLIKLWQNDEAVDVSDCLANMRWHYNVGKSKNVLFYYIRKCLNCIPFYIFVVKYAN